MTQLLDYREAAIQRRAIGRSLELPPVASNRLDEVARLYALREDPEEGGARRQGTP